MSDDQTFYVQLTWEDPTTHEVQQPILVPPIAIGRETGQMPERLGDMAVSRLELTHRQVSRFHALINVTNQQLYITDCSANGTYLNGRLIEKGSQPFSSRDTIRIGPYKITATLTHFSDNNSTELNLREPSPSAKANPLRRNTLLVWLLGLGIFLLMGLGSWILVSNLLEQARPRLPEDSQSMKFGDF